MIICFTALLSILPYAHSSNRWKFRPHPNYTFIPWCQCQCIDDERPWHLAVIRTWSLGDKCGQWHGMAWSKRYVPPFLVDLLSYVFSTLCDPRLCHGIASSDACTVISEKAHLPSTPVTFPILLPHPFSSDVSPQRFPCRTMHRHIYIKSRFNIIYSWVVHPLPLVRSFKVTLSLFFYLTFQVVYVLLIPFFKHTTSKTQHHFADSAEVRNCSSRPKAIDGMRPRFHHQLELFETFFPRPLFPSGTSAFKWITVRYS